MKQHHDSNKKKLAEDHEKIGKVTDPGRKDAMGEMRNDERGNRSRSERQSMKLHQNKRIRPLL